MKTVEIYTDGSCLRNPGGPGGWAAILVYGAHEKEIFGCHPDTTNNRMELQAAIEGLKALKQRCSVTLYSDSQYVVRAFQDGWIRKWQLNGWKTGSREPVKNPDLWEALWDAAERHEVTWVHVAGHAGHVYNERCDKLARAAAAEQIPATTPS